MLVHQLAAAHRHAMQLIGEADIELNVGVGSTSLKSHVMASGGIAQLTSAAARIMDVFQKGILAVDRSRNGGRQQIVVQHVHVSGDAQAIFGRSRAVRRELNQVTANPMRARIPPRPRWRHGDPRAPLTPVVAGTGMLQAPPVRPGRAGGYSLAMRPSRT